jgi:nucleotide-binding universal stress UspA family protein
MYKDILVSVDLGNAESELRALETAVDYARTFGSRLHVMTVVPDYGMSIVGGFFPKEHEKEALEHANKALHEYTAKHVPKEIKHRHIVGHEGAMAVREKLRTVSEEMEDFVDASLAVDIFDTELTAEARVREPPVPQEM